MASADDPWGLGSLRMGGLTMADPEQPLRQPPANTGIGQPPAAAPPAAPQPSIATAPGVPSPQEYMKRFLEGVPFKRVNHDGSKVYDSEILHDATVAGLKSWSDMHEKSQTQAQPMDPYKAALAEYSKAKAEQIRKELKDGPQADPVKQLAIEKLKLEIEKIRNPEAEAPDAGPRQDPLKLREARVKRASELLEEVKASPEFVAAGKQYFGGTDAQMAILAKAKEQIKAQVLQEFPDDSSEPAAPASTFAPAAAPTPAPAAPAAAATPVPSVTPAATATPTPMPTPVVSPAAPAAPLDPQQSLAERLKAAHAKRGGATGG